MVRTGRGRNRGPLKVLSARRRRLAGVFVAASFVVAAVPASARPASVDQAQPEEPAGNHGLQQEYDAVLGEELELQAELDQIVARRDQVGTELARLDADLSLIHI